MEEFGSVLVRLNEGVTPELLQRAVTTGNRVVGTDRTGEGNPIFDAGDVDHILVNQIIVQFRSTVTQNAITGLLDQLCARIVERSERPGGARFLLTFRGQTARHALAMVNHLNRQEIVQFAQPDVIVVATDRIAAGLASGTAATCPAGPSTGSIDPLFPQQWHLDHSAGQPGNPGADINAPQAWNVAQGRNIIVAILDDAVETAHNDLAEDGKIHSTWNAYTKSNALKIKDQDVHGTPVAGIVGAITGNSRGVKAVAPTVKLMPIRVIRWMERQRGEETVWEAEYPYSAVLAGIEHAIDSNAHVISMSLSLGAHNLSVCPPTRVCQSAIEEAIKDAHDTVLVFAAGNDGLPVMPFPPLLAKSEPVIAVGATDNFDLIKKKLNNSDWGSNHGEALSVVAPGLDIVTIDRTASTGYCSGDYVRFAGTSASTPIVAGVAALMQSQVLEQGMPLLSPQQLKDRLVETATSVASDNLGNSNTIRSRRVDACKALKPGSCSAQ